MMFLAFGILMPWGAFVSRYMKSFWWWFPLHIVIQMVAVLLTVASFIIIYTNASRGIDFLHAYFGLAALGAAWISPILGLAAHLTWNPNRDGIPIFPDKMHWYIARLAILLGFTAIFMGILYLVSVFFFFFFCMFGWVGLGLVGWLVG
jgi:hypothetical protein